VTTGDIMPIAAIVLAVVVVLTIIFRGGKAGKGKDGFFIDIPAPGQKILREKNGSRTFIESELFISYVDKMAALEKEIDSLPKSSMERAMSITEGKLKELLYKMEEFVDSLIEDRMDPWFGATGAAARDIVFDLIKSVFVPSFANNGFYEYRAYNDGVLMDTPAWEDFCAERAEFVSARIKHEVRRRFPQTGEIPDKIKEYIATNLADEIKTSTRFIYDRFWRIQHGQKKAYGDLIAKKAAITEEMKSGRN
jgi:hypothetical protein